MANRRSPLSLALGAVLIATAGVSAQLRFEVVSVRLSPIQQLQGYRVLPGRYTAAALTLTDLITHAYEMPRERVVIPEWTRGRYFAVEATMPPDTSAAQLREMLRTLLEDRFALRVRRELREMPVLLLVKVRPDGRLGPELKPVQTDCSRSRACFERQSRGVREIVGNTWEQIRLASWVSGFTKSVVLDRTGLSGQFDLALRWQFDVAADATVNADRPATIEAALEEQLGLKLEPAREPVEMLVVDNVAMPSEN
jgi:uncharacterized protein (TIGR03435 family)